MDVVATINPILPAIFATVHDFSLTYNPPARNDDPARVRNPLIPPSLGGDDGIIITMELADRAEMQRYQGVGGAGWCEKNRKILSGFGWLWYCFWGKIWRESPAGISRHISILHVAVISRQMSSTHTTNTQSSFGGQAAAAQRPTTYNNNNNNNNNNNKTTSKATSSLRS
jgi:hypothetical protein